MRMVSLLFALLTEVEVLADGALIANTNKREYVAAVTCHRSMDGLGGLDL
jgi:hypothetical protein